MTTTVLIIESAMAGRVIGRGGIKIKNIQKDSGAVVSLIDGDTADTRKVKITGADEAQRLAKSMVEKVAGKKLPSETITAPVAREPRQPRKQRKPAHDRSPSPEIKISADIWAEIDRENAENQRKLIESLPVIKKYFYEEHDEVKAMSDADVEVFRFSQNEISVKYVEGATDTSRPIPKPVKTFHHAFHPYPKVLEVIKKQKFINPSPIQCQAWPIIMSGHDLIAIAQTGTGKTLAYILPALIHLLGQPTPRSKRIGPSVVILGPTRELVLQIEEEINKYSFDDIDIMSLYGGVDVKKHQDRLVLDHKPDIVVATPGRLNDMISTGYLKLDHVSYMVLDEADRMIDMGFRNQIELSLRHVRPDKQTILTSATWPIGVQQLAKYYTPNPVHVTIGSFDLTTVNTVEQKIIVLKENEKEAWLDEFVNKSLTKKDKVIIFMRKKSSVDKLYSKFLEQNIECRSY